MWSKSLATAAVALAACGTHYTLWGAVAPSAPAVDGTGTTLELPPAGDVRGAALDDGWPVWLVRHGDGSVTVLSALAPRMRSGATLFAASATLVRWLPAERRFLAGDVVYDEYGHALGYATDAEVFVEQGDLDAFVATSTLDRVVVGELRTGAPAPSVSRWVDWDHDNHVAREVGARPGEVAPLAPVALDAALQRPIGSYALVAGSIVQSTRDVPRVCTDTPTCAACDASSPLALGVSTVAVDKPAAHAESGMIVVRREAAGLVVIATSHMGACHPRAVAARG